MTTTLRAYRRSWIMEMRDKVGGVDSGGRSWWWIFRTTGIDTAVEEMRDGNRRDVGRRRWRNELEERQWTGQISTGNYYQPEGVLTLQ